jgi:hypothetical protein
MGANGKVSLVPIAILIGGKFWDASAYKAEPVPMALDPGTVYEGERAGSSLGLFTINSALHSRTVNSQIPWIATGKWVPAGNELAKTAVKAETAPVGIDKSDEPPRLTRDPTKVTAPAGAPASGSSPSASAPSSSAPASSTQSSGQSGSGDEPPRLTKGASTAPATPPSPTPPTGSSGPATTGESKPDSKNGDSKPSDTKADNRENVPASDSGASEANRPRLRRGKPVEPLPDDDVPGYSRPGATAAAASSASSSASPTADAAKAAQAKADAAPVDLVPAISDATGPQARSYAYEWLKDEEGERRVQMVALAKQKVRAYVEALAKATMTPATGQAARHASSTKAATKIREPILDNVQMTSFDVWTTNQPVMVFSAQAHMPLAASAAQVDSDSALQYSVLMVAYPDTYNNLHPIYVGITDKYHLDLTPRLELVDVVDADGDGRGEFLFREITDGGNGWVIYRATADTLYKMFDSLHPE